jgi:hypothetical protein
VGISSTQTLTNKTLTAPVIATITNNGNTLTLPTTADTLVGRATTDTLTNKTLTAPTLTAPVVTGGATVRGDLLLQNTAGGQPTLQLSEDPDNGTAKVTIQAPADLSGGDYTLTLPGDDGNNGQVLQTNGSGVLSWASPLSNPMTTEGDIIYSSDGSGTPARLAIGASGTILKGGTTPSWASIVNADVSASAAIAESKLLFTHTALGGTPTSGTLRVRSGTYTPTVVAGANMDSITAGSMQWMQVGNVVTCVGNVVPDATANGTANFTMTLPVTPTNNFAATTLASGTLTVTGATAMNAGRVFATSGGAAKTVTMDYYATSTSGEAGRYTFSYVTD